MSQVILLIGANGRSGVEIIRAAKASSETPQLHAFVRTPSKLPEDVSAMCTSVMQGDATNADDVERALKESGAGVVVLSIGWEDLGPTAVREVSARVLMDVVKPGGEYAHVRIVCISSLGAGGTAIRLGFGMGAAVSFMLRHVLKDHDRQEEELKKGLGEDEAEKKRLLILHPTRLSSGKPKGDVALFGDGKGPTGQIDRADLAKWIIDEICGAGEHFGTAVNITGK